MSKVVRLNDDVLDKIDKVSEYMKTNVFNDDPGIRDFVFDRIDENDILSFVLLYYLEKHGVVSDWR